MKCKMLTSFAFLTACAAFPAYGADFDASASIGGQYANIHGGAKSTEYTAQGSGMLGQFGLDYRNTDNYYLYLDGSALLNFDNQKTNTREGEKDLDFQIKAGQTDTFKTLLYYNEIPHNVSFGAKTFLNGVGGATLAGPTTNPTSTSSYLTNFDYSLTRKNYGAEGEISLNSPFFFLARVDRGEVKGLTPMSLRPYGVTGALIELPAPVDYATNTMFLQTGYRTRDLIVTLDGTVSNFENANLVLNTWAPTSSTANTTSYAMLPPDNHYYKVGGSVMYRIPFLNSTFMARGSHAISTSQSTLFDGINQNWNGYLTYTTANIALSSAPTDKISTRLYYNYFDRHNTSDIITSTAYGFEASDVNHPFSYHKNNAGFDVDFKLPAKTKLSTGYEYLDVIRKSEDSLVMTPETTDHKIFVQAKNDLLDWVSGKVRYEFITRNSSFPENNSYGPTDYEYYYRAAGYANRNQHNIKLGLDFEPLQNVDLGIEYTYKLIGYKDTTLGLKDDKRHEVYTDLQYQNGIAKVGAYADVELYEANATFREIPLFGSTSTSVPDDYKNFTWKSKRNDINYAIGASGTFDIIKEVLSFGAGYRYESANGSDDFSTSYLGKIYTSGASAFATNITSLDDYTKHSVNASLKYTINKHMNMELGYLYEHLKYSDDALNNYLYIPQGGVYLTGAYANPNYDANVVYTKLSYKF